MDRFVSPTRGGENKHLRIWHQIDIRPVALLLCAELVLLRMVTKGQYAALSSGQDILLASHTVAKALAFTVLLLSVAVFLRHAGAPWVAAVRSRQTFLGANIAALLTLLVVQASLPVTSVGSADLPALSYAAAIALLAIFSVTGVLLLLPAAWAGQLRRPAAIIPLLAIILAVIFTETEFAFSFTGLRSVVEGTTLSLALQIYSLLSDIPPYITYRDGSPLMIVPGFGVIVGPGCSGYQGIAASLVLLGAYAALERKTLRFGRAALVVLAAVVGTFLLNATRIALLFHIGVTVSPEMAVEGFHSHFGTLAVFTATAAAILVMETAPFRTTAPGTAFQGAPRPRVPMGAIPAPAEAPEAPLLLPLAVLLIVSLMVGLTVEVVNWFYGLALLASLVTLYIVRHHVQPLLRDPPTLAGFAAGVLVFGIWVLLVQPEAETSATFSTALFAASPAVVAIWIVIRSIGAIIVVPLVEELAFRGALQPMIARALGNRAGWLLAQAAGVVGSSVVFGLLHSDMLAGFAASLVYGSLTAWQRGRVTDAILAHAVTNLLLVMTVLVMGHWSYW
jgi:uncharacterized protein